MEDYKEQTVEPEDNEEEIIEDGEKQTIEDDAEEMIEYGWNMMEIMEDYEDEIKKESWRRRKTQAWH